MTKLCVFFGWQQIKEIDLRWSALEIVIFLETESTRIRRRRSVFGDWLQAKGTFPAYEPLEEKAIVVANAQRKLATCYEMGLGVALDLAEALRLYRLAVMQGNSYARYYLGTFYQNGIHVKKDLNEARQYYYLPPHKGTKKQDRLESLETL